MSPNLRIISLLLHSYNFVLVMNCKCISYAGYLICDSCERVVEAQRGHDLQVENHCSKSTGEQSHLDFDLGNGNQTQITLAHLASHPLSHVLLPKGSCSLVYLFPAQRSCDGTEGRSGSVHKSASRDLTEDGGPSQNIDTLSHLREHLTE